MKARMLTSAGKRTRALRVDDAHLQDTLVRDA
jgi:hypothetical protein